MMNVAVDRSEPWNGLMKDKHWGSVRLWVGEWQRRSRMIRKARAPKGTLQHMSCLVSSCSSSVGVEEALRIEEQVGGLWFHFLQLVTLGV